jgi:hypothetical protein
MIFKCKYGIKPLNIYKKRLEIINPLKLTNKNLLNLMKILFLILKLKILLNVKETIIPNPYAIEFALI